MAAKSCVALKKSSARSAAKPLAANAPAPDIFGLMDNQDSTVTVTGVDSQGAVVDISALYDLSVSSDALTIATVGTPPTGMTFTVSALLPGTANLFVTATAKDGSGSLTFVQPLTVTGSAATGLKLTFGTPTIRP